MLLGQLFINFCVLVTLTVSGSQLYAWVRPGRVRHALLLAVAALAGLVMLRYSVLLEPGIRVDLRAVPVAVVGLLGGPLAALLVAVPTAVYRLWLGGSGAASAVLLLALTALISGSFHFRFRGHLLSDLRRQWWLVVLIFAGANLGILSIPGRGGALFALLYLPLTVFCGAGALTSLHIIASKLQSLHRLEHLEQQAHTDPLTLLGNRRQLEQDTRSSGRLAPGDQACCVVLLDIDHFKAINDTYGHPTGDRVLQTVAQGLRQHLSRKDGVYRYGGEEFALVLQGCTPELAHRVTERVRGMTAAQVEQVTGLSCTLSAGVAALGHNLLESLAEADRRLYQAKRDGRDRTVSDGVGDLGGPEQQAGTSAEPQLQPQAHAPLN